VAPPAVEVQPAASPQPDDDPVRRGLAEIQRAEQMHRELAEQQRHANAGATPRQQKFIEQHPILMAPYVYPIARQAYLEALAAGLQPDTDANENFVLEKTGEALRRQREAREAMPPPNDEYRRKLADQLEREAAAQMDEQAPGSAPRQMAPTSQRSMPVSAPVSRSMPSVTGRPVETRITLSPEERDVARRSYANMPPAEAERLYAEMKGLLIRRRAAGTYTE
jgi:hypothetical protein